MTSRVEGNGSCEGSKGSEGGRAKRAGLPWGFQRGNGGNALEVSGRLRMGAVLDFSDQIDDIASTTGGEAVPQTTDEVHAESGRVVTAVEGTGSEELIAPAFEPGIETVPGEDTVDPDLCFEMPKRGGARMHFDGHPGRL